MQCQSLYSGENQEKNIVNLSSAEFPHRVLKDKPDNDQRLQYIASRQNPSSAIS